MSGPAFDPDKLRNPGPLGGRIPPLREHMRPLFALLRAVRPVCHVPFQSLVLVTRYDDVAEVLRNDSAFGVPYGPKIELMAGENFLLGFDDGDRYQRDRALVVCTFPPADVRSLAERAAKRAGQILRDNPAGVDAMKALVTPVLLDICQDYFGVLVKDRDFPLWAMAASGYLFEPFGDDAVQRTQAEAGAQRLRDALDHSIKRAHGHIGGGGKPRTVIERLVEMQRRNHAEPSDTTILALIITMIVAMVPTGTLAAGNMLEILLRRPDMMAQAQAAAHTGDDDLLRRCLFEALRFLPVSPVWPRDCKGDVGRDSFVLAPDTRRATPVRKGSRVLAATQSAMFDSRRVPRPRRFDPARPEFDPACPDSHSMVLGYGPHRCLGAAIASAVIPAILKPLLRRPTLARAPGAGGRRRFYGVFPEELSVTYQS